MPAVKIKSAIDRQDEMGEHLFQFREMLDVLTRAVHERTNRMIGDLRIEISKSEVVLWGRTRAYYYKQLASQAVLAELTGVSVVNEIQVI